MKPLYREAAKLDPFCSTQCARKWWGTSLPEPEPRRARAYRSTLDNRGAGV